MTEEFENWHDYCIRIEKEMAKKAAKATKFERDLALAFGCIDYDRCN